MIVTDQELYSLFKSELCNSDEVDRDNINGAIHALFTESLGPELTERIAQIADDAIQDAWSEAEGNLPQHIYSNSTGEELFSMDQEEFASLVAHVAGAAKGIGLGVKYLWRRKKYRDDSMDKSTREQAIRRGHSSNFWGRVAAGHESVTRAKSDAKNRRNEARWRRQRTGDGNPVVNDPHKATSFMKGKTLGVKNKHLAIGAGVAAAGTAGYLAYRHYKKKKAAQQAQEQASKVTK